MRSAARPQASASSALAGRRWLTVAALGCAVAAGLVLLAVGRVWLRFSIVQAPLPRLHGTATGHAVAGVATPLAYVVLAGVVALPATRKAGRRVAGLFLALAGIGIVVAAAGVIASPRSSVASQAGRLAGRSDVHPVGVALSWWPWLAIAGGLVATAAGVLTLLRSADWPAMGRRYEAGARRAGSSKADETSMWDRLDRGDDPTL